METVFVREQDKVQERIRNLEKGKKELQEELTILKLRLAALENERKSLGEPTGQKTNRKGKKVTAPAL